VEFDLVNPDYDSRITVLRPCGSKKIAKISQIRQTRTNCAQNHGLGGSRKKQHRKQERTSVAVGTTV